MIAVALKMSQKPTYDLMNVIGNRNAELYDINQVPAFYVDQSHLANIQCT